MDWTNEHYIRVYTRDTTTWKLLGWDGQSVMMQVFRKLDAAGVLEIDTLEPWEAVVIHCGAPEAVARNGMQRCLERGVFVHNGQYLFAPKFQEAQHSSKSDRQRQKESRETRAAEVKRKGVTNTSQVVTPVTERDCSESQTVTDSSQPVTNSHKSSLLPIPMQCSAYPSTTTHDGSDLDGGGRMVSAATWDPVSDEPKPESVGHIWFLELTTKSLDVKSWKHDFRFIGSKPFDERVAVARHIRETEWCASRMNELQPTHVVRYWLDYLRGPRNFEKQVSAAGKHAGPSEVVTQAQLAADKVGGW